jgi:hypothetical protein
MTCKHQTLCRSIACIKPSGLCLFAPLSFLSSHLTPEMPSLLLHNATSRTLDLVLRGKDDAVIAGLDEVRPGTSWTYTFRGDHLVLKTLEVDVYPATGVCAGAAYYLNAVVLNFSPPVALFDPLRTPRPLLSSVCVVPDSRRAVDAGEYALNALFPLHRDRFGPLHIVGNQEAAVRIRRDGRCELALQPTEDRSVCVIA